MKITFDPKKAASNFRKHGVRFSDAESVLFDPTALTREDEDAEGEQCSFLSAQMPQVHFLWSFLLAAANDFNSSRQCQRKVLAITKTPPILIMGAAIA